MSYRQSRGTQNIFAKLINEQLKGRMEGGREGGIFSHRIGCYSPEIDITEPNVRQRLERPFCILWSVGPMLELITLY